MQTVLQLSLISLIVIAPAALLLDGTPALELGGAVLAVVFIMVAHAGDSFYPAAGGPAPPRRSRC